MLTRCCFGLKVFKSFLARDFLAACCCTISTSVAFFCCSIMNWWSEALLFWRSDNALCIFVNWLLSRRLPILRYSGACGCKILDLRLVVLSICFLIPTFWVAVADCYLYWTTGLFYVVFVWGREGCDAITIFELFLGWDFCALPFLKELSVCVLLAGSMF